MTLNLNRLLSQITKIHVLDTYYYTKIRYFCSLLTIDTITISKILDHSVPYEGLKTTNSRLQ